MKFRIITVIAALALILFNSGNIYPQFGKNKVQYKEFKWQYIQSKHFDVYFSQDGYELAQYTAVVAESSLVALSKSLDYNLVNRIPIIVFNSHNDFQQNNVIDEFLPEGVGGVTEMFKNRVLVPFEGNYEQFRHVINHELTHGFLNDMFYGGSIQNIISKNITLNIPLWFNEGMAEVQSFNGLDKATDIFIRDAILSNYLPPIDYNDGYLAYRGGQSFFAFLNDQFGDYKLGELMSNIRGLNDIDEAFKETYKMNIEKLSEKWIKELKKEHYPEIATREDIKDFAKMLTNHMKDGGSYNISPVISPKGDQFAFISNRNDFFSVYLADINTGRIIDKVVEGNTTNNFEELQVLTPGLTWSPDGKKLAISVKAGDKDAIFIIDMKTGEETRLPIELNSISNVKWSPNPDRIAFIGTTSDRSDLYIYDISKNRMRNLTDDVFSDYNPSWTPDGKYIYFSSDRAEFTSKEIIPSGFKMFNHDPRYRDVYKIDVETGKMERITNTYDTKNSYVNFSEDGKKLLYVSDRNGISNIFFGQFDSAGNYSERPITNSLNSIDQISLSKDGKKLLFVSLNEGGYDIFSLDNPFDRKINLDTLPLTQFEKKREQSGIYLARTDTSKKYDTLNVTQDNAGRDSLNLALNRDTLKKNADTLKIYGSDIKIKLKDLNESKKQDIFNSDSLYANNQNFKIENNLNSDGSFKANKYKIRFTPDLVYGNAIYSSYYGVQGVAQVSLSDMLGNHRITLLTSMVIDLKNSDYAVAYQYMPKRIDYGFELYHTARFVLYDRGLGTGNQLYRYRTIGGNVNMSYPINRFNRIDGGLALMSITRENLDDETEPLQRKYLTVPSISYVHDNTLFGYLYPEKGTRYNLTAMVSPYLGSTQSSEFYSLIGDFRKYFKIGEGYSFAMRLTGGSSFGKNPQKFYLGGIDNWINWNFQNSTVPFGESIDNFAFASLVTPLRGFNYNAKTGSKYALYNMELRFPIFRYLILGALPLGFQNIMGNLFLDAGTAWDDTKKLQLLNKSESGNVQTNDLLMAPGFGMRIVLFGFPARMDVAWQYNLQRFSSPMYMFSLGLDY
ncbi:MAG: DPP IV N-terminal domain-containing protein [Bacteroidetes bacterium]|nr:DPP IV N-terminal domain-containing protein [Bacteroidota bacterium]